MKKYAVIVIIISLFALNIYCKANDLSIPKPKPIQTTNQADTTRVKTFSQTPEYVQNALKQVGKLIVLEGNYNYSNVVKDKIFMDITLRQMTFDLNYKFGLGMNLEYIIVKGIYDKIIVIQIPKRWIEIQYVELDTENSNIVDGKKIILASDFKPVDVQILLEQSQENVVEKIKSNDELFDQVVVNLKSELEVFLKGLGFKDVIFEVI